MSELSKDQLERYNRNIVMDNWGIETQSNVLRSKVLIIGLGGLGSPVAYYLTAAGVGHIGVMDNDVVDLTNLQRQIIHTTNDINRPKIESAIEKMTALNPGISIQRYPDGITVDNAVEIVGAHDFVVSATDNFESKYLINDACVLAGVPFCHSGVVRYQGQIITVLPGKTACFRCLFPSPPPKGAMPSPAEMGVLGAAAGIMGTMEAAETIKFLTGSGDLITDTLLNVDVLRMDFQRIEISRNPDCPVCGKEPTIKDVRDAGLYEL